MDRPIRINIISYNLFYSIILFPFLSILSRFIISWLRLPRWLRGKPRNNNDIILHKVFFFFQSVVFLTFNGSKIIIISVLNVMLRLHTQNVNKRYPKILVRISDVEDINIKSNATKCALEGVKCKLPVRVGITWKIDKILKKKKKRRWVDTSVNGVRSQNVSSHHWILSGCVCARHNDAGNWTNSSAFQI